MNILVKRLLIETKFQANSTKQIANTIFCREKVKIKNVDQIKCYSTFSYKDYFCNKHKEYSYTISQKYHGLHLLMDTLPELLNTAAQRKPNDVSHKFMFSNETFTFLEMKQNVDDVAQSLLQLGFQKGDRLAIMLPNIPELVITYLAAVSIGVISVLMNPAYQKVEIEYMLKKTGAKGIVLLDELKILQHYELLRKIIPEFDCSLKGELNSKDFPDLKHIIIVNILKKYKDLKNAWTFTEFQKLSSQTKEKPKVFCEDPCTILFTSGTTGLPKAAMLSHFNLLNTTQIENIYTGVADSNRINCCSIPIFHIFGLAIGILTPIFSGSKTIFSSFFPDTLSTMKAIHTEKCTALKGPPIIFIDLLNHPERAKFDLSSLEYVLFGASTIPVDLILKIKSEIGVKNILVVYGMTETSGLVTIGSVEDQKVSSKAAYESIGRVVPFTECKIIDSITGETVPRNVDGEILTRGYNRFLGYFDDEKKTNETIDKNGWVKTGDIACMDEHGYLFFKSRTKELIIRGGMNIYPAEIEKFLRQIDGIYDAYVIGVPDERHGEEVCAWIKLKPDANSINADKIRDLCKEQIAYHKIPKYIKFVDSFPVNATGKIQKFKMVQMMKEEMKIK